MPQCIICLKVFDEKGGKFIKHHSGNEYFFCKTHALRPYPKCEYCGKIPDFGEWCCIGDEKGENHDICWTCWKERFPLSPYVKKEVVEKPKQKVAKKKRSKKEK